MFVNIFRGNVLTGLAVGIGVALLAPTIAPMLRPAAKAVIKSGILAYQGLVEIGEMARIWPLGPKLNWSDNTSTKARNHKPEYNDRQLPAAGFLSQR